MKTKSTLFTFMLVLFTFLVGCNTDSQSADSEKKEQLSIYTTIFPLEDFTKKIGGEHVNVTSIYPPGADAHTFEPSTKTMSDMASADAFIYTGVGVEGFADKAKDVLENENVKIVAAGLGIELRNLEDDHDHEEEAHEDDHEHEHEEEAHEDDHEHEHEEEASEDDYGHEHEEEAHEDDHEHEHEDEASEDDHGHEHEEEAHEDDHDHEEEAHEDGHDHEHTDGDPHVWLDPALAVVLAENIKDGLVELKPDAKEDFEANFQSLKEELEILDAEFKETIDQAKTNKILVSHAAYGYWEGRYGLEQISVSGLSPTQEPSQKQLTEIINTAKENSIQYVIFDQNISGKIAEVVKNEIKAEALTLHNLEAVSKEDIENEEDYFSIMRQNLETLKKALN